MTRHSTAPKDVMGEPGRRLDSCSATPHPTISG